VRSASERTNSSDQEVVAKAHPLRMRGLKAYRFAGAIRTLAQLLRRALTFVRDVTYTLGKEPVAQT
jgi:transcriptional regulator with PAS, ATPase and Fis domain